MKKPVLRCHKHPITSFAILLFTFVTVQFPFNVKSQDRIAAEIASLKKKNLFNAVSSPFTVSTAGTDPGIAKTVSRFTILAANESLAEILRTQPEYLELKIPIEQGLKNLVVLLYKSTISPGGINLMTNTSNNPSGSGSVLHYRGSINDDAHSVAAFSFSDNETMGLISNDEGNYVLGKIEKNQEGLFVIYNDKDLLIKNTAACGSAFKADPAGSASNNPILSATVAGTTSANTSTNTTVASSTLATTKCVNWYWETDYDVYANKGSLANVNAYMQGIFNQVSTLYANDGIGINLKTLYVWTSADPYTGPSTGNYLSQFGSTRTSWNGDLAHLVGFAGNGGIAYVNGIKLCEYGTGQSSGQQGYSGISASYNTVPLYSWTVECITHEQGHQLGSNHTHDCVWNGNNTKIDDCGGSAGYSGGTCTPLPNPLLPVGGGTIMSYCHLTSAGINFNLGFGPQPKAIIINKINASTCLTACSTCSVPGQPGTISGNAAVCPGTSQTYSINAVPGASSYTWTIPTGWTGTSTTNSITATTGTSGGTITVKANNSCGISATQQLAVTIAAIPTQPGSISGSQTVCPASTQTYSVTAVSGATSYTWSLPPGWTGTSTTNAITATTGTGGGTITVKANSSCGSGPVQSLGIAINSTPPAQPSAITGSSTVCANSTQTYTATAVSGASYYTWSLPSGWTGTSTTNTITATTGTGGGTITVKANSSCGSSPVQSMAITMGPGTPAQPGAVAGNSTVCSNIAQNYTINAVPGATSYAWTLPAGWTGSSTGNSIVATPGTSGGTITVAARNSCGSSTVSALAVSLGARAGTPGTITVSGGGKLVCAGETRTYTVPAVTGWTYNWIAPAGTTVSSGQGSNSIVLSIGSNFGSSGTLSVTAANGCGTSAARTLTISKNTPVTPASISIGSGINKVCPGDTRSFSTTATSGVTYEWTVPAGAVINAGQGTNIIQVSFTTAFTRSGNVTVKAVNGCGTSSARTFSIYTNLPATPGSITVTGGIAKVCNEDSRTYTVALAKGVTYNWTVPAGAVILSGQGTNSITVKYSGISATGSLSVTANNSCGTSAPRTISILLNVPAMPSGIGVTGGIAKVCPGDSRTYSVTAVTGLTYNWVVPTGAVIAAGQGTHTIQVQYGTGFTAAGSLSVTAKSTCGNSPARTLTIDKNLPATPGAISGTTAVCAGKTYTYTISAVANASAYTWAIPAGAAIQGSSTGNSINVLFGSTAGNISVSATNGCGNSASKSLAVYMTCTAGLEEKPMASMEPKVYPNPSEGQLNLEFYSADDAHYRIIIYDLAGKALKSTDHRANKGINTIRYNLVGLSNGLYLVSIENGSNRKTLKFEIR